MIIFDLQENAHFTVVDMVLEVLEGVKWTLMMDTHKHTSSAGEEASQRHEERNASPEHHKERKSDEDLKASITNTHPFCAQDEYDSEEVRGEEHQKKTFSVLSSDSGFEGTLLFYFNPC